MGSCPLCCALSVVRRLVVWPGPGLLHVAQFWLSIINFACNSPAACSNIEFASLELQRFLGLLKVGPIELHAKFVWPGFCCRLSNFARNSPAACSNIEFASLELQRFWAVLKSDRGKLCAKLIWRWLPRTCVGPANLPQPAPRPGPVVPSVPSASHLSRRSTVVARSISASRSVQNSPCLASWW